MAVVDSLARERPAAKRSGSSDQKDGLIWRLVHDVFSAQARGYYGLGGVRFTADDGLIFAEMAIIFIISESWMRVALPALGLQSFERCPWAEYVRREHMLIGTPVGYAAMYVGIAGGVDYLWTRVWSEEGARLKIQPTKQMTVDEQKKAWVFAAKNILSTPCLSGIFFHVMRGESNIRWGAPCLSDIPWFVFVYLVVDLMQYIIHRVMHRPWWYQRVHKVHHMWKSPNAWVVSALHPAEHLMYTAPMLLISCSLPMTFCTWLGFLLLVYVCSAMDHSGMHLDGVLLNRLLFWQSPPEFHDRHHEFFHVNFGVMVDWWDRLAGTCYEAPNKEKYTEDAFTQQKEHAKPQRLRSRMMQHLRALAEVSGFAGVPSWLC